MWNDPKEKKLLAALWCPRELLQDNQNKETIERYDPGKHKPFKDDAQYIALRFQYCPFFIALSLLTTLE